MLNKYKFTLEYKLSINGKPIRTSGNNTGYFDIETKISENQISVKLLPKTRIYLVNAYLEYEYPYNDTDKVYVNGYQSWTTSREYKINDVQNGLRGLAKYLYPANKLLTIYGDYDFQKYSLKPGRFHSYSYTYIKEANNIKLFGTLNERTGYTVFHHNMSENKLLIQKDVEGVAAATEYPIFDIYFNSDNYETAFDKYFEKLTLPKLKYKHLAGYTSWYNYYGGITEEILMRDLEGLSKLGDKVNIFQIDDGYQTATGDWLSIKKDKYPNGMKYMVDKIHSKGYLAGLWLAPFNAQFSSRIAKEHKNWFVTNPNGKRQLGSIAWNGAYTLDFYKDDVKEYIKNVFNVVVNDWGFDMVKLDFLYSICRTPRYGKSRGQIMCEAMDFLRECVGDKLILGCGVPLFPAFGKVDFCRISSDVGYSFTDPFYIDNSNQEALSTKSAMNNTIFRRHLDGRAFVNDPDVFYVRKNDLNGIDSLTLKKSRLKFTEEQKELLALVNNMCGNVLFVSDNVGDFDEKQMELVAKTLAPSDKKVLDAEYIKANEIEILYEERDKKYKIRFDVNTGENSIIKE